MMYELVDVVLQMGMRLREMEKKLVCGAPYEELARQNAVISQARNHVDLRDDFPE